MSTKAKNEFGCWNGRRRPGIPWGRIAPILGGLAAAAVLGTGAASRAGEGPSCGNVGNDCLTDAACDDTVLCNGSEVCVSDCCSTNEIDCIFELVSQSECPLHGYVWRSPGSCACGDPVLCPPSDGCKEYTCDPATGDCLETEVMPLTCNADVTASNGVNNADGTAITRCADLLDCISCVVTCDVNCDGTVNAADIRAWDCRFRGGSASRCCCLQDADCVGTDADVCTEEKCVARECVHNHIAGCCNSLADCPIDADICKQRACRSNHTCGQDPIAGCCTTDPQCIGSDTIPCTSDTCNQTTHTCQHTPNNAACADTVACTVDTCHPTLGCQHTPNNAACADTFSCTSNETCHLTLGCQYTLNNAVCDDGLFCDGAEKCRPTALGHDSRGCITWPAPCPMNQCDEVNDRCRTRPGPVESLPPPVLRP